jgi:hypothetical protein
MAWTYGTLFNDAGSFIKWLQGKQTAHMSEIHVHHTYAPSHKDFNGSNHKKLQDGMKGFHIRSRGFQDIAQHITIFPDGKIMTGRNINVSPASATNYNDSDSDGQHPFMFEIIGNFDLGHDKLQGKQLESAVAVTRYFYNKGAAIKFHREMANKSCPGSGVDKTWFVNLVKATPTTVTAPKTADNMHDLSYLKDGKLIGLRSSKHPNEIHEKVTWTMEANANCVLLLKRGYDLRILQKALNEMYPENK